MTWALKSLNKNFHFNGLLLSKVCIIWAKKVQKSYLSWNWRGITKFAEESTCRFKIDMMNFTNFDPSTEKSKIFVLSGSLFELQKYWGVIFYDTEELCTFWRKTDLWFEKRLDKFGKFSPEHLKVSKLGLWWDPFVQSRKGMRSYVSWQWRIMQNLKRNSLAISKLTWGI